MKEQGIVIEISGEIAKIRLVQKPECAKCGMCAGAGGGYQILTLKTQKPLQINQLVTVKVNHRIMTFSHILLYGTPVSGFIFGAIIGYVLGKEIMATIFAIGFLAVDLIIIKILIKKLRLPERMAEIM